MRDLRRAADPAGGAVGRASGSARPLLGVSFYAALGPAAGLVALLVPGVLLLGGAGPVGRVGAGGGRRPGRPGRPASRCALLGPVEVLDAGAGPRGARARSPTRRATT